MSTFMGLETSKRGLFTQQTALYTTGHNISNANTLGYSRQRVNMEATAGFPGVGLGAGTMPGFLGTGVQAGSIQRIRDGFVDQQYRQESNKLGYWESKSQAVAQMEDVLAEPSEYGLQQSLSDFWASLNDLAVNPENAGARTVVVRRGEAVADSFNHMHKSLSDIQTNLGKEISVTTNEVNAIFQQITELNEQIAKVEPNGYLPNDLYDARDRLVDQLSTILPIEVSYDPSGGRAPAIAEGSIVIRVKTDNGSIEVLKGTSFNEMSVTYKQVDGNPDGAVAGFNFGTNDLPVGNMVNTGKMKSLVESFGYMEGTEVKGMYPNMMNDLNRMANAFAVEFNNVHKNGTDLNGEKGKDFFVKDSAGLFTAENIKVSDDLLKDPNKLAASDSAEKIGNGEIGNGNNAKNLAGVQFLTTVGLEGSTIQSFYQGVIGRLGVEGRQAANNMVNSGTLLGAVENRRASISSVSLDEEMTDMIRFQQAYNASARMITVVDETLDKIINGMGVVGR
ncbi:flagellar hook-associated protein FlgK [Sporosarcina siberiensis]|uniref:Flagellar hook-associated protein 1 n=1 Tax=Sporosarcina siberiensis TaxID=1365606 RepID=A0ABW4SD65_9BACL